MRRTSRSIQRLAVSSLLIIICCGFAAASQVIDVDTDLTNDKVFVDNVTICGATVQIHNSTPRINVAIASPYSLEINQGSLFVYDYATLDVGGDVSISDSVVVVENLKSPYDFATGGALISAVGKTRMQNSLMYLTGPSTSYLTSAFDIDYVSDDNTSEVVVAAGAGLSVYGDFTMRDGILGITAYDRLQTDTEDVWGTFRDSGSYAAISGNLIVNKGMITIENAEGSWGNSALDVGGRTEISGRDSVLYNGEGKARFGDTVSVWNGAEIASTGGEMNFTQGLRVGASSQYIALGGVTTFGGSGGVFRDGSTFSVGHNLKLKDGSATFETGSELFASYYLGYVKDTPYSQYSHYGDQKDHSPYGMLLENTTVHLAEDAVISLDGQYKRQLLTYATLPVILADSASAVTVAPGGIMSMSDTFATRYSFSLDANNSLLVTSTAKNTDCKEDVYEDLIFDYMKSGWDEQAIREMLTPDMALLYAKEVGSGNTDLACIMPGFRDDSIKNQMSDLMAIAVGVLPQRYSSSSAAWGIGPVRMFKNNPARRGGNNPVIRGSLDMPSHDAYASPNWNGNYGWNNVWANVYGSWEKMDAKGRNPAAKNRTKGIAIGYDRYLGAFTLGGSFSYGHGKYDYDLTPNDNTNESYSVAFQALYENETGFYNRTAVGYSYVDSDYSLYLYGPSDWLRSSHHSNVFSAANWLGYAFNCGSLSVIPQLGLIYQESRTPEYTTTGALRQGFRDLRTRSLSMPVELTVRYDKTFSDGGALVVMATGGYEREFLTSAPRATTYFVGSNSGSATLYGVKPEKNLWSIAGELQYQKGRYDISAGYKYSGASSYSSHQVYAGLGIQF